jgi:hypothetical protein
MSTLRLFAIVSFLLILPACGLLEQSLPVTESERPTPQTDALTPLSTAIGVDVPAPDAAATTKIDGTSAPVIVDDAAVLPEPTLFDIAWDDREIFRAGLIEAEQEVLDGLPGASVYHMNVTIDEPTAVSGQMQVRYTNQENIPLDEIYFHLFPNQLGGSITVSDVSVNGEAVQPDTQDTALRVPLQTALDPGQAAVIQMEFMTTVPPEEESTKYNILAFNEDILALAHFYPMIAAYDDQGWHIEPSPPHGDETYADMSHFLLQVTAPVEQVVVTTGVEIDRSETGSTQTITIAAAAVRDFFLAMSDRYGVVSENVGPVQINSYAPLELLDGAEMALDVTAHALRSFSERFGPYPYNELDIVSTPTQALGIEYPGIFANALRIYDLSSTSTSGMPNEILLEGTTAHEAAHQWFYNLVGNDQLNEPWLDEATTQYATWMYYIDRYGEQNAQGYYESLQGRWARNEFADIPIGMPAEAYSGADYGAIVYGRGPIFLDELAQEMGQETFDAFLRDYSDTFRWNIATSEDFQALVEEHCQCDLSAQFNESVYAN